MCWADKIAIVWAVAFNAFVQMVADNPDPAAHAATAIWGQIEVGSLIFVLPVWVVLRLIDWIIGGPARRRGVIAVRPLH